MNKNRAILIGKIATLVSAIAFFASCKTKTHDETVKLSGKANVKTATDKVRSLDKQKDVDKIYVESEQNFQELEAAAMKEFATELKRLFGESNAYRARGNINPRGIESADSLVLVALGYLVKTIEMIDPCADLRAEYGMLQEQLARLQDTVARLTNDSITGAGNVRGAIRPALKDSIDIENGFWIIAEL